MPTFWCHFKGLLLPQCQHHKHSSMHLLTSISEVCHHKFLPSSLLRLHPGTGVDRISTSAWSLRVNNKGSVCGCRSFQAGGYEGS